MRLWSIHPGYLDATGLVACWREGLLARKVLQGHTKGYRDHPQLDRFKEQVDPILMIDTYLMVIYEEAALRGYKFNRLKIGSGVSDSKMEVTNGQLQYELSHLKEKLRQRSRKKYAEIANIRNPEPHPLFSVTSGGPEKWERLK